MKKLIVTILVLLLILLTGCGDKGGNKENDSEQGTKPVAADNTDSKRMGYIIAEKVRLREEPHTASTILDELEIGMEVGILEQSDAKDQIGIYNDYWYKIQVNGQVGWCYGVFLTEAENADSCIKERIEHYFYYDSATIKQGVEMMKAFAQITDNQELMDLGARKIIEVQKRVLSEYEQLLRQKVEASVLWQYSIDELNAPAKIKEEELKEVVTELVTNGYRIYMAEGDAYIEPDPQFILDVFGEEISAPFKQYLELEAVEVHRHMGSDGGIIITWDELADRIAGWDRYIQSYPDSEEAQGAAQKYYERNMRAYTYGADNTPIFDYSTGRLKDEVKKSYERFMEKYSDTKAYHIIKRYYELLKENGFKRTDEATKFLEGEWF